MVMNSRMRFGWIAVCWLVLGTAVFAQEVRHEIHFPNLPGYQTLKCDLHMHTVFSDGNVWPTVRVDEAWRQGLDAIAITDHIEYQPHKDDIPTKHNRPFELALKSAQQHDLLLIRGSEITRDTPPGHFNGVFLEDCSKVDTPDFLDSVRAANEQGAFVFWNHQGWKGEEKGSWRDVHTVLYQEKLLHGMEVANGATYYPSAHKWCLEKDLTMMGTSDIHAPDLRLQSKPDDHRTMTLVFAKDRTVAAVKEALQVGRTAVWYQNQLVGRREYLEPLFEAAITIKQPVYRDGKYAWLQVHNSCDVDMTLERTGGAGPATVTLPACSTVTVRTGANDSESPIVLEYIATNLLIAPETGLPVRLVVDSQTAK